MAEPARESASRTGNWEKGKPHPCAPGWADVRGLHVTAAERGILTLAMLAGHPGDPAALHWAELLHDDLVNLAEITRRCVMDESILESIRAEAYAQGVADCKASRCHLEVVPAPH